MRRLSFKSRWVLAGVAGAIVLSIPLLKAIPGLSTTKMNVQTGNLQQSPALPAAHKQTTPQLIATAPQPPQLVRAVLGGKPIHVLYMTRADDTVLVRCYPTFKPVLELKDRSGQPGEKEGILVCKPGNR